MSRAPPPLSYANEDDSEDGDDNGEDNDNEYDGDSDRFSKRLSSRRLFSPIHSDWGSVVQIDGTWFKYTLMSFIDDAIVKVPS